LRRDLTPVDDAGAQVARLEVYAAWARAELARLTAAGAHPERQAVLRENLEGARVSGFSTRDMISGAGHDAAYVSRVAPAAMIFVPCKDGISHNEAEFSSKEQCAAGAQVLLQAVLDYDRRLAERDGK